MCMLGDIYYFIGLILFLADLGLIMKFSKIQKSKNWVEAFFKVTKRKPNKQDMDKESFQELNSSNLILTLNFLWIFFGLITKSWKFYLVVLFTNLFLNSVINKIQNLKSLSNFVSYLKMFLLTSTILLLVINHFHLHKDLFVEAKDFLRTFFQSF